MGGFDFRGYADLQLNARDCAMNKAQQLFVEWSLGVALMLASLGWAVALAWGIGIPFLSDCRWVQSLVEEVFAPGQSVLAGGAKFMAVFAWIWLCLFVRLGRKK